MLVSSLTPFFTFAKGFRLFCGVNTTLLFNGMFRDAFMSVDIQSEGDKLKTSGYFSIFLLQIEC